MAELSVFSVPWVLATCIIIFACFIRATTGFGQNLIMTPILLLILDPKSVVAISIFLGLFSSLCMLPFCYKELDMKKIVPLIVGSLIGIPIGTYIIVVISASGLKMLIGSLCVVLAIPLAMGWSLPLRREKLIGGIVGFLSGFFTSSTSIGGPPAVLYMHNQNWGKESIRSNLNIFFVIAGIITITSLYLAGVVNWDDMLQTISLVPALLAGLGIGILVFPHISGRFFRLISMAIVIIAGIIGVLSGFGII
jgi:uncharacterized membrane protein YfcA